MPLSLDNSNWQQRPILQPPRKIQGLLDTMPPPNCQHRSKLLPSFRSLIVLTILALAASSRMMVPCRLIFVPTLAASNSVRPPQERHIIRVAAELKLAGDELILEFDNESDASGRILITIALGDDSEIRELGQSVLEVRPRESGRYLLSNPIIRKSTDSSYILTIRDVTVTGGRLLLYQHARVRTSTQPIPAAKLALGVATERAASIPRFNLPSAGEKAGGTLTPPGRPESYTPRPDIQLQARLLAGPGDPPVGILSFDLYAERPQQKVDVEIALANFRAKRTISIDQQSNVQFELPAGFDKMMAEPVVHYLLRDRHRQIILEGDLPVASLTGSDGVVASDLRFDQSSYLAGDQATLTLLLEGRPNSGINIEISLRDEKGQVFQTEQRYVLTENFDPAPGFTLRIPSGLSGTLTVDYRILDIGNRKLYDAGQRDILVRVEK